MKMGKVIGPMELRGAELLGGQKCVLVNAEEQKLAAVNRAGAKAGERVLLVTGSAASRLCMDAPVDAVVVAVVDENVLGTDIPMRDADKSVEDTFRDAEKDIR